jgi:hypothetical protein
MLVSAAMAERPRATAGRTQAAPSAQPPAGRHSTARVAPTQGIRRTELPGWFWGALGCLTVLVVGLTIVFVMGQSGVAPPAAAATVNAVEPAPVAPPPAGRPGPGTPATAEKAPAPSIHIEPMAAPARAVAPAAVAAPAAPQPKPRAASRPIKMAHSPAAGSKSAAASKPAADGDDSGGDDAPKAKAKAPAADSDDEPAVKRTSAEDEALDR